VARCLLIGCGCRGRALARELLGRGHVVRGTTRDPTHLSAIEAAGAEAVLADPDRVVTIDPALDRVTLAYLLLGSAVGARPALCALHGERLEMLLTRMVDTTVRGVAYEIAGSVDSRILQGGAARARRICEDARIPYALLDATPEDHAGWVRAAVTAVGPLLHRPVSRPCASR
jgi:uncharacterized protein YbjT (DUF2867 family)